MSALFVTGAGTEIGKTYVSCALLRAWRAQGVACDALKPVVSGYDEAEPEGSDPGLLLEALGRAATPGEIARIAPLRFRAPLAPPLAARAEGTTIDYDALVSTGKQRIGATQGMLLIEGAGGVMSPLTDARTMLDLIADLGAPVVFVAGSYLGAVSHALTGLEVLKVRGVSIAAVAVSESLDSVGLNETCAMIRGVRRDLTIYAAPRGVQTDWAGGIATALKP
ncbi:MAG: dethiobiotin synthase [Alphaproteobacteria bacterium]